eukprot:TRINITY_DN936_c3_g3_i1.p1 TRINITY_DN936_c3_g3~~TRINITY_DN936_c3_g3_i1.p1  ORF type:complete len:1333 (+),score=418.63 TRINITY_DN936_c3_g3_i1:367-3999(+)
MSGLRARQAELQAVEQGLAALQAQYEGAVSKKQDLEGQVGNTNAKLDRATKLIAGLGGERARWSDFAAKLGVQYTNLTGDVLVSAGVMAYLGPFTALFRQQQLKDWLGYCRQQGIPCSESASLSSTLGDPVRIRQWNIEGLPTDTFSIDNAIIVFNARRWPLMIDPQGQANKWVRAMEKEAKLAVMKLTDGDYLRTLENAVQFGQPVLLENVGEELDPSLEPLLLKQIFKQGGMNCIRLGDATVEYSSSFRFYMTTKLRNPHYLPEISVKVTLLNFMITPEGLQDQLLGITVEKERPDLEEQKGRLILEGAANKRMLKEIEDKILRILSTSEGNILEDQTAIETLSQSKVLADEIQEKQAVAEKTEHDIDTVRRGYAPIAHTSQTLFFCITDLANIEPVYQYSLSWFIALFANSIARSEKSRDIPTRLLKLREHFTLSLYRAVCRSLLERDKLLFSFLLCSRINREKIDEHEWMFLLTGGSTAGTASREGEHPNPCLEWLSDKHWEGLCRLADLPGEGLEEIRDTFGEHAVWWRGVYESAQPEIDMLVLPPVEMHTIRPLCILRCIRPDKVTAAAQEFVIQHMGETFVEPPVFDLTACFEESNCATPLVFILSPGSDPMGAVLKAAEALHVEVHYISLGQGQGPLAERMISEAAARGSWVVLQNCHLCPSWMTTLEKTVEGLHPDWTHANFRLWCTTYPSDVFPVSVLQSGVKMTLEAPKGLRANLLGSYNGDPVSDPAFFSSVSADDSAIVFRRLLFGLCFFHAVVQERRLYGPIGWNIPYEFNESDLSISARQAAMFIEESKGGPVPFKALRYTAGECNYGGRVTDDKDRRTLHCLLERVYQEAALRDGAPLSASGVYVMPADGDGTRATYVSYIESLPLQTPPDVFGLHDNANISRAQQDTQALFNKVQFAESGGGGGGGGGGSDKDAVTRAVASDILSRLPEEFDMEAAQLKYPVLWEDSLNTVLCQELARFNALLAVIRRSLNQIRLAIDGLVVMSAELEVLGMDLFFGKIPALWKPYSYPSLKPLASYITDLLKRIKFFDDWLQGSPPSVFWICGFFFTQAFLTGASQNYARRYMVPIDNVVFQHDMLTPFADTEVPPPDGVFIHGLYLEGARWDKDEHTLAESYPKVLFSLAPIIWFRPMRKEELVLEPHYNCPVYKTSDRRGVLSTTGHSTNFICYIRMASTDIPESHWVMRGVCMLTTLDD